MPPAVLLSLGVFAPPTVAQLRAFERARDFVHLAIGSSVVEGLLAPIPGVFHGVSAKHRIRMVEAAVRSSPWLRSACWQCSQPLPHRPSATITHYVSECRRKYGPEVLVFLLLDVDEIKSMGEVGSEWTTLELESLFSSLSFLVLKQGIVPLGDLIYRNEVFRRHQHKIHLIEDETFPNSLSSSRVRTALSRGESIRYCVDDAVLEYIQDLNLFDSSESLLQAPPTPPSPPRITMPLWRTPPPSDSSTQAESYCSEGISRMTTILTGRQLFDLMDNAPLPSADSPVTMKVEEKEKNVELEKPPGNEHCVAHVIVHGSQKKKEEMKESPRKEDEKKKKHRPPPLHSVPGPLSPDYDNVTLDDLLIASTSWAEFMGKQAEEIKNGGDGQQKKVKICTEEVVDVPPAPPPPMRTTETTRMEKRRGWLCGKPKRPSDDSLIGICGTDRRKLGQLSPEILRKWRKFHETDESPTAPRKTQSSRCVEDPTPSIPITMSQSLNEGNPQGVTLTFRRYQLASAPETTV